MDYLQAWTNALSGAMSQSYKPIVALTIFDLAEEEISITDFVDRLSEFFWQLERRFNLKHGPVRNDIHAQIVDCMNAVENSNNWATVRRRLDFKKTASTRSAREIIWQKLCEMPLKKLPQTDPDVLYTVHDSKIEIHQESLMAIQANKKALVTFARCRLGEFLEKFNSSSPRVNQKVKIAWEKKRPNLPKSVVDILKSYHSKIRCYICDQEILGTPDWDHVIPFSHIGGHDIWNLMPACGPNSNTNSNCNQIKSARLPTPSEIDKTRTRNGEMLIWLKTDYSGTAKGRNSVKALEDLEFEKANNELTRLANAMNI